MTIELLDDFENVSRRRIDNFAEVRLVFDFQSKPTQQFQRGNGLEFTALTRQPRYFLFFLIFLIKPYKPSHFNPSSKILEMTDSTIKYTIFSGNKNPSKWVCLKIGYTPNYSHLVGIMIINHWVFFNIIVLWYTPAATSQAKSARWRCGGTSGSMEIAYFHQWGAPSENKWGSYFKYRQKCMFAFWSWVAGVWCFDIPVVCCLSGMAFKDLMKSVDR